MPSNLQYVNNHILVNSTEYSTTADNNEFLDLHQNHTKSKSYGRISREEVDIWEKM